MPDGATALLLPVCFITVTMSSLQIHSLGKQRGACDITCATANSLLSTQPAKAMFVCHSSLVEVRGFVFSIAYQGSIIGDL